MAANTSIEWAANADGTPGATWNPIRAEGPDGRLGFHCVHASEGCRNCYAERLNMSPRFPGHGTGLPYAKQSEAKVSIFLDEARLAIPLRRRKPTTYFLSSMTDVFADFVTDDMLNDLFAVMALAKQHTFIVLTKRADRMRDFLSTHNRQSMNAFTWLFLGGRIGKDFKHDGNWKCQWPLPNVWPVVSVEDTPNMRRIFDLLETPAAVRGVSIEPMIGPVDLSGLGRNFLERIETDNNGPVLPGLDWVICGGESGPNARPMHPDWARSLRDQCAAAGVPFFFKQWGEWAPLNIGGANYGIDRCRDSDTLHRWGKARAGRLLDGIEHNGRPKL